MSNCIWYMETKKNMIYGDKEKYARRVCTKHNWTCLSLFFFLSFYACTFLFIVHRQFQLSQTFRTTPLKSNNYVWFQSHDKLPLCSCLWSLSLLFVHCRMWSRDIIIMSYTISQILHAITRLTNVWAFSAICKNAFVVFITII